MNDIKFLLIVNNDVYHILNFQTPSATIDHVSVIHNLVYKNLPITIIKKVSDININCSSVVQMCSSFRNDIVIMEFEDDCKLHEWTLCDCNINWIDEKQLEIKFDYCIYRF